MGAVSGETTLDGNGTTIVMTLRGDTTLRNLHITNGNVDMGAGLMVTGVTDLKISRSRTERRVFQEASFGLRWQQVC
jgi:hypothetical protein